MKPTDSDMTDSQAFQERPLGFSSIIIKIVIFPAIVTALKKG